MKDLQLISGVFFDLDIPKSKQYLFKYFHTEIQQQFVRYYLVFGGIEHFVAHTGLFCKPLWLKLLLTKLILLEQRLKEAKDSMDFTTVALIESGKFKMK